MSSIVYANEDAAATRVYSLGEVVVSENMPAQEAVTEIEITAADIEMRHANTLDKALELLPGVDVTVGAAGTPRVNVRGLRSRHTILLLNGVPVNSTYDHQFNPNLIPTDHISKIKMSYGGHSVLYGQGGLAGVINIITKQGTKGFHGTLEGELDDRGNHISKGSMSGGNDLGDLFLSVSNTDKEGFAVSDDFDTTANEDGGLRENSGDERLSFFGNAGFELFRTLDMGLTVEHSSGEYGLPVIVLDDKKDPFYKSAKYERVEDFETFSSQLSLSYDPDGMFSLRAWGFTNQYDEQNARYDDDTYTTRDNKNSYAGRDETRINGATLQAAFDLADWGRATASVSGEEDTFNSDGFRVEKKNKPATEYNLDHEIDIWSAAFEYRFTPLSVLELMAGYSHHWQEPESGSDDDKGSYMIAASLKILENTTVRASYAHKIRFPSIRQLYDADSGNTDLKPEEADNFEIGLTRDLFWDLVLDLSLYHNRIADYIEKNDSTDLFENNDEYEFTGVDLRLSRPILDNGMAGVGYSFMDSEDKSDGALRDDLQYRPRHKLTLDASYTWAFGLTAHADLHHVADQCYYSSDLTEKGELDDYTLVNLKLEQAFREGAVSVYLGVDNLLDEDYQESYGYPRAGITGYAGMKLRF